jgi:uncharacterized protein (DUF1499 family)
VRRLLKNEQQNFLCFAKMDSIMNMAQQLYLYEGLTEAGIKPDAAHRIEREISNAINHTQEVIRTEMNDKLITKADGLEFKVEIKTEISQIRSDLRLLQWMIGFVFAGILSLVAKTFF